MFWLYSFKSFVIILFILIIFLVCCLCILLNFIFVLFVSLFLNDFYLFNSTFIKVFSDSFCFFILKNSKINNDGSFDTRMDDGYDFEFQKLAKNNNAKNIFKNIYKK